MSKKLLYCKLAGQYMSACAQVVCSASNDFEMPQTACMCLWGRAVWVSCEPYVGIFIVTGLMLRSTTTLWLRIPGIIKAINKQILLLTYFLDHHGYISILSIFKKHPDGPVIWL